MQTIEFLAYLRSLDIQVVIEDEKFRCTAPEGTLTPTLRAEIQARKAEIVAFLAATHHPSHHTCGSLVPISRSGHLPLSFAQQRLWFLDRLIPNNPFYNIPLALNLTGTIDLAALERTFNEIVRRHEALRTTMAIESGQPVQVIHPTLAIPLPVIDLTQIPAAEREIRSRQLTERAAQEPFDLSTPPLLRVKLLRLEQTRFILLLTLHHIVADGWSLGVLMQEISALYPAFASNRPSSLPELPIQYADFAYWQRQCLQGRVLATQLSYWQQQLEGISLLNLPTDRPRLSAQTYQGARQPLQLSPHLSWALLALSQQEGVTLFITLLAAFQVWLCRYTQQEDIAIGSPIANRNRSEIEGLIGFFVNSLVLRTDLSGNPTFREVLKRVKQVALGAYTHQDLPFEKLVAELDPERSLNKNPLFQVVFALQTAPISALELPDLILSPLPFTTETTRFDLELHLWEPNTQNGLWADSSDGISGFIIYSTDLFDAATIERMTGHFQTLLEGIVANPEHQIGYLPLLSKSELDTVLVEWNATQRDYPQDTSVDLLFESVARQYPDSLALVSAHEQLTYNDLNIRSNKLAHYLKKVGVKPEVLVGIYVERSCDLVVGMLGILKAGGAYVPIDPTYPAERVNLTIRDAKISILLTHECWLEKVESNHVRSICMDTEWAIIEREAEANLARQVGLNNLAYVIYTSGSTGNPKGVEIEHRGLLNLVCWHQQTLAISAIDRATQITGVGFDACGWEIWPYLSAGSSIYFVPDEIRHMPERLRDWWIEKAITIAFLPTPLAEKILLLDFTQNTSLRILLTGGDKLSNYPQAELPFQLVNNYGPTESTVVATSGRVDREERGDLAPVIGRAIANTQIYILDKYLQPVPIGIPGEIYIGGDGLARGYLNRPELTSECFIDRNVNDRLTVRLYKTGDRARYRIDGNLEFLGRLDDCVKIRGYRIELGEIESVLNHHPAVSQAVVLMREDRGEKTLVAYVSTQNGYSIESDNSRSIQLQDEQVSEWQMLYNETYTQPVNFDPKSNIVGWNSSYTSQPLPAEQMSEWMNNQVDRILAFQPQRVLEIGCGTGLMLFRIAPHCERYWGTDFSSVSIDYIQQQLARQELPQIQLFEQMATDFDRIEPATFDTVILNSVIQYFPTIDYLINAIAGAITATAPGGRIFIGDVRSLPLLTAFHTSVQLDRAEPSLTCLELQQRVQMQIFQEPELAIDPAFFTALQQQFPQIDRVQIQLLRGKYRNELTGFRYNAILEIGDETSRAELDGDRDNHSALNWSQANLNVPKVRQLLIDERPEILSILNVPNARVMSAVTAAAWLADGSDYKNVGQIRKALQSLEIGVDPEDWYAMDIPYRVEITWSSSSSQGDYDVMFICQEPVTQGTISRHHSTDIRPWHSYANNPLQAKAARQLVPQLQSYLAQKLPEYMLPSAFVVLDSLPLTANGKIDRRALAALPDPSASRTRSAPPMRSPDRYIAPRNSIERELANIFVEVLGLKRVGIYDNFFELGGHSLLATQLVSRVRDALQIELPLRSVFEAPTIDRLARVVASLQQSQAPSQAPALVPLSRESRRMKLSAFDRKPQGSQ
ncbi:non-ribosomal peptide synthetase [Chamaesiphon minutus]|uniref:Amino acid adenylation enzyme/thioester reductase family protein n=1 Tax=Chamaesiphon minutus (strain ATCC 27169 / PCC 6605) TaxID=1173020 RepID=K9UBT1_CHAP6|nr:non-ribosomal peptide synthetase [Chamaesiphon minutus]AFY92098.1 amino acid adenylation enzyme/thioester reductase family protein [Chamaesiphon minutus PCC 6605]